MCMTRMDFLGSPVDSLDMREALERIDDYIAAGGAHQVLVTNANKLWCMRRDAHLAEIARAADMVIPEKAVVVGAALLGTPLKAHVGGSMLAMALLPHSEEKGHSIFFLGARPAIVEALIKKVRRDYPALPIAGYHHGYFLPDGEPALLSGDSAGATGCVAGGPGKSAARVLDSRSRQRTWRAGFNRSRRNL